MRRGRVYNWLQRVWYADGRLGWILLPLSGVYWLVLALRRALYDSGILRTHRAAVPVVVDDLLVDLGRSSFPASRHLNRHWK